MPTKVVDASAAAAIVFAEPDAASVAARLAEANLLAPTIFGYELANICMMKLRRFPDIAAVTVKRYAHLSLLNVRELGVDHADCLDLARRLGLTAYDASYLWVARSAAAELVTLDQKLARAAATL